MSKIQFGDEIYDRISEKIDIPQKNKVVVNRDLRHSVSLSTLEVIDKLLNIIDGKEVKK